MLIDTNKFTVKKFSYFSAEDFYDLRFQHTASWSRVYEYPFVLREISSKNIAKPSIHNASWGFSEIHIVFKTWLDSLHENVYHSDIRESSLWKTHIWDITSTPRECMQGAFDFVINVSTLEEIPGNHTEILKNHLNQLKKGGVFIGTFDIPGLQIKSIEEFLDKKIITPDNQLTPKNSRLPNKTLAIPDNLSVCYLTIERK